MTAKMIRAVIFIDGNNFYHGMREKIGRTPRLDFDYAAFSRRLVEGREWVGTRYYVGKVQQEGNLKLYQRHRKFIAYLERFEKVSVWQGRLEKRPAKDINKKLQRWLNALPRRENVTVPQNIVDELTEIAYAKPPMVWGEKAVDVMLATDMVAMAYEDQYDVAYLISADGDFTPAVKKVRDSGRRVLVASTVSGQKLAGVANTFIPMKREFFDGCWLR